MAHVGVTCPHGLCRKLMSLSVTDTPPTEQGSCALLSRRLVTVCVHRDWPPRFCFSHRHVLTHQCGSRVPCDTPSRRGDSAPPKRTPGGRLCTTAAARAKPPERCHLLSSRNNRNKCSLLRLAQRTAAPGSQRATPRALP